MFLLFCLFNSQNICFIFVKTFAFNNCRDICFILIVVKTKVVRFYYYV